MNYQNILILENFKAFKGQHEFDLSDINILTGANNAGKSTIIKAIKLFSNGISKGDFPALDLVTDDYNFGEFKDVVNRDSGADNFKIGFYTKIGDIEKPFKVMYSFKDGKDALFAYKKGKAIFKSVELINDDDVFLGVYQTDTFKVTKDNIEFDIDDPYLSKYDSDYPNSERANYDNLPTQMPFKSPSDHQYAGLLIYKFNVELLKKYITQISNINFKYLLFHLDGIKGNRGNWWGEAFNEQLFFDIDYDISELRFHDLLSELLKDSNPYYYESGNTFYNIADTKLKFELVEDTDIEDELVKYKELLKNSNYEDFIRYVFFDITKSINLGLEVFKTRSISHFSHNNNINRLITIDSTTEYLLNICSIEDYESKLADFSYEALKLFGLNYYIEIINHLNSSIEINLVDIIVDLEKDRQKTSLPSLMRIVRISDYSNNQRINISDLGKGTANLLIMIIKLYNLIHKVDIDSSKAKLLNNNNTRKTLIIEEPEAFLHPNWQSKLADLFVLIKKRSTSDINIVIETHSVYLIQKLQLLVAKGEVEKEKINILYFERDKKPYRIHIRKDGILKESFGTGFYDETARLTSEILYLNSLN